MRAAAFLLNRYRAEIVPMLLLALLVGVTAFLAAVGPRLFNRVADEGLRYDVERAQSVERNVELGEIGTLVGGGGLDAGRGSAAGPAGGAARHHAWAHRVEHALGRERELVGRRPAARVSDVRSIPLPGRRRGADHLRRRPCPNRRDDDDPRAARHPPGPARGRDRLRGGPLDRDRDCSRGRGRRSARDAARYRRHPGRPVQQPGTSRRRRRRPVHGERPGRRVLDERLVARAADRDRHQPEPAAHLRHGAPLARCLRRAHGEGPAGTLRVALLHRSRAARRRGCSTT